MEESLLISDECIGCGKCVSVCIRGHLAVGEGRKVREIDSPYYCFRCGHCSSVCPKGAIALRCQEAEPESVSGCPVSPEALAEMLRWRRSCRWFDRKCTREELQSLIGSIRYAPTAENSQAVQYAVIDERFPEFMELLASILRSHTGEHPRLKQFVEYVDDGQKGKDNPFTWEGRQVIVAFARFPIDAIIPMEQLDLMAYAMGLGGFHSRWMLQASENDPERFRSFFPGIRDDLTAYAVFVIGHPRIMFRRAVPRDERKTLWLRVSSGPFRFSSDFHGFLADSVSQLIRSFEVLFEVPVSVGSFLGLIEQVDVVAGIISELVRVAYVQQFVVPHYGPHRVGCVR